MISATDLAALDALIEELTVDAYGDEEQLVGFLTGAEDALIFGEIATVAGVEIRIVRIECRPDARRGPPCASEITSAPSCRSLTSPTALAEPAMNPPLHPSRHLVAAAVAGL